MSYWPPCENCGRQGHNAERRQCNLCGAPFLQCVTGSAHAFGRCTCGTNFCTGTRAAHFVTCNTCQSSLCRNNTAPHFSLCGLCMQNICIRADHRGTCGACGQAYCQGTANTHFAQCPTCIRSVCAGTHRRSQCDACGTWVCDNTAGAHFGECPTCRRSGCIRSHRRSVCDACKAGVCDNTAGTHFVRCPACGGRVCATAHRVIPCQACSSPVCGSTAGAHFPACSICNSRICRNAAHAGSKCRLCDAATCPTTAGAHNQVCSTCGRTVCWPQHQTGICRDCRAAICVATVRSHDRATCQSCGAIHCGIQARAHALGACRTCTHPLCVSNVVNCDTCRAIVCSACKRSHVCPPTTSTTTLSSAPPLLSSPSPIVSSRVVQPASSSLDTYAVKRKLVITFIDIGQGNATLIECPRGEKILIDCGSVTNGDARRGLCQQAREFLVSRCPDGLDYLLFSHPDKDHINAVREVLSGMTVKRVFCGGKGAGYEEDKKKKKKEDKGKPSEFIQYLGELGMTIGTCLINDATAYSEGPDDTRLIDVRDVKIWIVSANAPKASTSAIGTITSIDRVDMGTEANTNCIVIRIEYAGRAAMICGDATFSTEAYMLGATGKWAGKLAADILTGGHHGSTQSFSDRFLAAVQPKWIHFSADNKKTFRHPTWEVVNRVLTNCALTKGYGPHGIVIGPTAKVSKTLGGKDLVPAPDRIAQVLKHMRDNRCAGLEALKVVPLSVWMREDLHSILNLSKPPTAIEWERALLKYAVLCNLVANPSDKPTNAAAVLRDEGYEELAKYWGRKFDDLRAEQDRIRKLTFESKDFYWDWSIVDVDLFTSLYTANEGVYWEVTVHSNGRLETQQI